MGEWQRKLPGEEALRGEEENQPGRQRRGLEQEEKVFQEEGIVSEKPQSCKRV